MHLFTDYIEPLTSWIYANPRWALLITFFIALSESLAIVGSIIPGSVIMTAVGILAGAGIMRIDLTILAATLGAIAGDSSSYFLGYALRERLINIWPFSRYPRWLDYGKTYFAKHGSKSVLLGRFIGPLRSIIPVIAGMMHMGHWRFLIANILSAIGWALLYVLPGILIGSASSELSPESATRLFIIILGLLLGAWVLGAVLKWLINRIHDWLRPCLHHLWAWSSKHPYLARCFQLITPDNETDHAPTATLIILLTLSISALLWIHLGMNSNTFKLINENTYLFMQSLRTHAFDVFFIVVSQTTVFLTLFTLSFIIFIWTIYTRQWRNLRYWLSLNCSCMLIFLFLLILQPHHVPWEFVYATAIFLTLIVYTKNHASERLYRAFNFLFLSCLLLSGLAAIVLGDYTLSTVFSAYFWGLSLSLLHWLFYRRSSANTPIQLPAFILLLIAVLLTSGMSSWLNYRQLLQNHQLHITQYVITDESWWNQDKPLLPIYRTNRIGKPIDLFNIQYVGSITHFTNALTRFGWKKQPDSIFRSLLIRVSDSSFRLPLMSELYLNQKPMLIMTYQPLDGSPLQILHLWRSNYHLQHTNQPLWLGTVRPNPVKKKRDVNLTTLNASKSIDYISAALPQFPQRQVLLSMDATQTKPAPLMIEPTLLLIRE